MCISKNHAKSCCKRILNFILHQWCKNAADALEKLLDNTCLTIGLGDLSALLERVEIVFLNGNDRIGSVQAGTALKMEIQATEIEIGGSHGCHGIVRNEELGVHKTACVFVDFYTGLKQGLIIRA